MLIDVIIIYGFIYISIFSHEMMHCFCAIVAKIDIYQVSIGFEPLGVRLGIFTVSPVLGPSYIEVSTEQLNKRNRLSKVLFYSSGIIGNIILALIFAIACNVTGSFLCMIGVFINIMMIIINSIPVGRTDIALLVKIQKNKRVLP